MASYQNPAAAIETRPDCSGPEYHALDFWLGTWDVTAEGQFDGDNVIAPALSGCAVRETWGDAQGWRGESLFFYDRVKRRWKQLWITSTGVSKEQEQVDAPEGAMRFQGEVPLPKGGKGGVALERTTLSKLPDGRVRQLIETSKDRGATWKAWEGTYARRAANCVSPAHHELDFWLGDWNAKVRARKAPESEEWLEARGANHVALADNGCTLVEDFHAAGPGAAWTGRSFSQLSKPQGKWRQTWVDDQNSYLAFTGGREGKSFVLYGEPTPQPDGGQRQMRMVFSEITPASFKWTWEGAIDGGKTWRAQLVIDYTRQR